MVVRFHVRLLGNYLLNNCQSGAWKSGSLNGFTQATGNSACGVHATSYAKCPVGKKVISGGWRVSAWSGNEGQNAPDISMPADESTWLIKTGGGMENGQCLAAVAYCANQ